MPIKADEQPIRPVISAVFKGRTGTGKSIGYCGKEFRPVYVFNCEQRFESVLDYYRKLDGHVRDVEYDNFPLGSGFYAIDKRMDELARDCPYKSVAVASLTSFIHLVLGHLIDSKKGKTRGTGQYQRPAGREIAGIRVNELEDYNAEDAAIIFELIAFLQQLKNQGVNVFLEAHITPYEITTIDPDSKGKETFTINQILTKGKKAPAQIPGYFNEVYLFEKEISGFGEKTKYKCNTQGTAADDCKTSMGIGSFEWTNQDFSEVMWGNLSTDIKETSRVDPNAPKRVAF